MPRKDGRNWTGSNNPNFGKGKPPELNHCSIWFEYKGQIYHSLKKTADDLGVSIYKIKQDPSFKKIAKAKKIKEPKVKRPRKPKRDTTELQRRFNLTHKEVMKFMGKWRAQGFYTKHRLDCNGLPIEFKISLEDWMQIWIDSGHWEERGAGTGKYVMSRFNDSGHYEVGNVFVQLHSQNTAELIGKRKYPGRGKGRLVSEETRKKLAAANGKRVTVKGKTYSSIAEAKRELGINRRMLNFMMREESLS